MKKSFVYLLCAILGLLLIQCNMRNHPTDSQLEPIANATDVNGQAIAESKKEGERAKIVDLYPLMEDYTDSSYFKPFPLVADTFLLQYYLVMKEMLTDTIRRYNFDWIVPLLRPDERLSQNSLAPLIVLYSISSDEFEGNAHAISLAQVFEKYPEDMDKLLDFIDSLPGFMNIHFIQNFYHCFRYGYYELFYDDGPEQLDKFEDKYKRLIEYRAGSLSVQENLCFLDTVSRYPD